MNSLASLLALVSLVLFCNGQPLSDIDDMCPRLTNILCVRDVLMAIASVAKNLNRTLNHIEDQIHSNGLVAESFNRYIQHERTVIYSHLATPQYHSNFFRTNNIDQKYLGHLLIEAHYSMSFYYNSINDVLNLKDDLKVQTDTLWKQVQVYLRQEMICPYRSILNIYSYPWPAIDSVSRIEFSKRQYRDTSSLVHDVRSAIILQLLREWMRRIHLVLTNIEPKFV